MIASFYLMCGLCAKFIEQNGNNDGRGSKFGELSFGFEEKANEHIPSERDVDGQDRVYWLGKELEYNYKTQVTPHLGTPNQGSSPGAAPLPILSWWEWLFPL